VSQGETHGLLGPHGSGKTTLLRILATILKPDGGRASLAGFDVLDAALQARRHLGYLSQSLGLDPRFSGRQNLRLAARLHGLDAHQTERRIDEALTALDLLPIAERSVGRQPFGVRKRLALAGATLHRPPILLLDDPTGGLSLPEQALVRCYLMSLRAAQTTIFLATHLMAEAESLHGRVTLIDAGRVVATGTPEDLKAQVTTTTAIVRLAIGERPALATAALEHRNGVRAVWPHPDGLEVEVTGAAMIPILLHLLEEQAIAVREITLCRPSLEEVFFRHTGRKMRDTQGRPSIGTGILGRR
jgi:ABC-2 type transport system ATP-binding protein